MNEFRPQWTLELFRKGFGIEKAIDTYRRKTILIWEYGSTGKSTLARLLAFALGFRNYVSLESVFTEKRRNSLMYFLSKIKRQVVIIDIIRRPFSEISMDFTKKKWPVTLKKNSKF